MICRDDFIRYVIEKHRHLLHYTKCHTICFSIIKSIVYIARENQILIEQCLFLSPLILSIPPRERVNKEKKENHENKSYNCIIRKVNKTRTKSCT